MLDLRLFNMSEYFQSRASKWNVIHDQHRGSPPENPLLSFCDLILKYEKYKQSDEVIEDDAYSPTGSEKTNDSYSSESDSFNDTGYSSEQKSVDTDDSWDLITCFCMKPFKGRPMIECNRCSTWLHMSCVKIRPNNVPDIFICQFCREAKSRKRRSERIRSDDQRFLSA